MQISPVTPINNEDAWVADAAIDRSNRDLIIAALLDPGPYTKEEEDMVADGLKVVDKLSDDKNPEVTLTKYDARTPLQSTYMCYDKKMHLTYGKVSSIVRGASVLDVVASLADYKSNLNVKHQPNPSELSSRILERISNHHLVFYYQAALPPPLRSRDCVWSFIAHEASLRCSVRLRVPAHTSQRGANHL